MAYEVIDSSTPHGIEVPHGFDTPHRFPQVGESLTDILLSLTKSLYPTGRAWQMPEKKNFENLHSALNVSFIRLIIDGKETINSTIPDNDKFNEEDAALWEYRLGLISNILVDLDDRKSALLRKLAYPANVKARQHPLYIETQLQAAGFDVYIHENTIPYQNPADVVALILANAQHGVPSQHGPSFQHGAGGFDVIANSIKPNEVYNFGGDDFLYSTFFISGLNIEDIATIPLQRQKEFRELVLKLKPAHTVAFLLINYT